MLIDPGHHLGDAWFHVDRAGVAHCWYLVCPDSVPRHTAWDIAHATSTDLRTWERHGVVLERGADDELDGGCLSTGSTIATPDGYLLAYTGRWREQGVATGLAMSTDLVTWTKHPANPISRPGPPYATGTGAPGRAVTHWRDPFLTTDASGRLQQLICASRPDQAEDASGAIAVVTEMPSGVWARNAPLEVEAVSLELECPQVVEVEGGWFLVFSCWPHLFSSSIRAARGRALRPGTYAMSGPGPAGPFSFDRRDPIVPAAHRVQLYAGQIVLFDDCHYLLGTVWRDDGPDSISDPIHVRREGDGLVAET